MYTVLHNVHQVDGNIRTYWHHVMQLMVMISDAVFQAHKQFGNDVQIVMMSNDPQKLAFYVEKYNWIPQLGLPIRYENLSFVMSHPYGATTRRCDPLHNSHAMSDMTHCLRVHNDIRKLVTMRLGLENRSVNASLLIVRESSKRRRVSNLGIMIQKSGLYALQHGYSFHSIMLEDMPLREQLQWFYSANHIVIARGSATANLLICRPSTRVIIASSPDQWKPTYWIPFQYVLSFAIVRGGNSDSTVTLDENSLQKALESQFIQRKATHRLQMLR